MKKLRLPGFSGAKVKESLRTRTFRVGTYSAFVSLSALAIAVVVNLLAAELPASVMKKDLTAEALYSISDQTQKLVSSLEEDVTIYHIAQTGEEDMVISEMLERYAELSDHVKLVKKDPIVSPGFTAAYTDETVYDNSLIVESQKRCKVVPYQDIYVTEYDYSSYFTTGSASSTTTYEGEGALTSAIDFVTSDVLPRVYALTGHGETALSAYFTEACKNANIELADLSLLSMDAVPADADAVLLIAPASDISVSEKDILLTYLKGGGSLLLFTDYLYEEASFPQLASLTAAYGLEAAEGLVIEDDDDLHLRGYNYYLLPQYSGYSLTAPLEEEGYYVLLPFAHGIRESADYRSSLSVTPLLSTSSSAYAKTGLADGDSIERAPGDAAGPFMVGALASETYNEVTTNLIWYSSVQMLDEALDSYVSGGNLSLLLQSLNAVCGRAESVSVAGKAMEYAYLTITSAQVTRLAIILVGVLPVAVIAAGVVVHFKRKKR